MRFRANPKSKSHKQKEWIPGLRKEAHPGMTIEKSMPPQLTPSFFCKLDDDVVYWNTTRLSGNT